MTWEVRLEAAVEEVCEHWRGGGGGRGEVGRELMSGAIL